MINKRFKRQDVNKNLLSTLRFAGLNEQDSPVSKKTETHIINAYETGRNKMVSKNPENINLKKATKATVTTIIDNYTEVLLPSSDRVERAPLVKRNVRRPPLLAEHGFSVLVEVMGDSAPHRVLMDFGVSNIGVPHNLNVLEIDVNTIEAFVVSHGHHDHVGSIAEVLGALVQKPRPVAVHPDAFLSTRFHKFPDGKEVPIPGLKKGIIEETENKVIDGRSPVLLASEYILALGEIPRVNDFEKGMPSAYYEKDGKIYKDNIMDDKGIVLDVKDKGLVVISGCGHSGIINTIRHAQSITGVDKIYCVMGGFHLIGNIGEAVIKRTIEEMKKIDPEVIVPCHCTGLKAAQEFEKAFPEAFVLNASGTTIHL
jgi:7,8-dihydropterin-6-yl-methyl-4-(beta-D-ribofuranosyl)aminobenzene 5'-phosphate synthase